MAVKILKDVMEEKISSVNVQFASLSAEKGFRIYAEAEVAALINTAAQ